VVTASPQSGLTVPTVSLVRGISVSSDRQAVREFDTLAMSDRASESRRPPSVEQPNVSGARMGDEGKAVRRSGFADGFAV
jgi:hypothetical protein